MATETTVVRDNNFLAVSTALSAGITNVCGAMGCYAFTANVTGHTTVFAQHMLKGNYFEMVVVFAWMFMFIAGSAVAHFLIRSFEWRGIRFAHAAPLALEFTLLMVIGIFGDYFHTEAENGVMLLTCLLLFAMGIQNSTVNTVSGGKIKTSHLTGLFTDLGAEISEWLHPSTPKSSALAGKIKLRTKILVFFILGALFGGWLFTMIRFATFYIIAAILVAIIAYDFAVLPRNKPAAS